MGSGESYAMEFDLSDAERRVFEIYRARSKARARRISEIEDEERQDQREAADVLVELALTRLAGKLAPGQDLTFSKVENQWQVPRLVVVTKGRAKLDSEAQGT